MSKNKRKGSQDALFDTSQSWSNVGNAPQSSYVRCYETHPALAVGAHQIYGGSCSRPVVTDADIYIGFDMSMTRTLRSYPWEQGSEVLFYIPDMGVPADAQQFVKLIDWTAVQLAANLKVHAGCIGGHGRTGTFLSALVAVMTGEKDAIRYVRENYCKKAVESDKQIDFLAKHFGITKVEPTKTYHTGPAYGAHSARSSASNVYDYPNTSSGKKEPTRSPKALSEVSVTPLRSCHARVWGSNVFLTNDKT